MNKINFKNLPDKTTPLNATNLNALQQNVEDAITTLETTTTIELAKKLDKTSKATSDEVIAGTNNTKYTTPASVKSAIDKALGDIESLLSEV